MSKESSKIDRLYSKLIAAELKTFPIQRGTLHAPLEKGVYIIISNRGTVLHVGNTPRAKNGISQRLKNHMAGKSSFTKTYFDGNGSTLRGKHKFKYLIVNDPRQRALLEAYAIGRLCPKHIGIG